MLVRGHSGMYRNIGKDKCTYVCFSHLRCHDGEGNRSVIRRVGLAGGRYERPEELLES